MPAPVAYFLFCTSFCLEVAPAATVRSPDGRIELNVALVAEEGRSELSYRVSFRGQPLVAPSTISFGLSDGSTLGRQLELLAAEGPLAHRGSWQPVYGERSTIEDNYNEIAFQCRDKDLGHPVRFVFRCYDTGVAFHSVIGADEAGEKFVIEDERTEFRFLGNPTLWSTNQAQGIYKKTKLDQMGSDVERPLTMEIDDRTYVAIAEAKLVDYARMRLQRDKSDPLCIVSELRSRVKSSSPVTTPWRVIMVGESPGELLENNDIILNLNDPCAIADTSWIKPGKVIRDITLTTAGGKSCIDFAVKHRLQYVEFDAGWYGHEYDDASDATTVTVDPTRTPGPLDLPYLIDYATERDIGVILYVNRRALETQLDEILPLYKSWGVKGVKFGFVNVGSQKWTRWLHDAIRKAAEHELMVDVHDEYRSTGYTRTYPNLMTQEGVRGDESSPPTRQTLTSLFTRSLAGASDFTICYFADRVDEQWTHAHQLAKAMCVYDPWQFLFWYDTPLSQGSGKQERSTIVETPELEFFDNMPTVWDDTKVIHGKIGEYAAIARRSGDNWFVGAMNDSQPRALLVKLDFLKPGQDYMAHIYRDDPSVDTITRVAIDRQKVDAGTTLRVAMEANGGQAIRLVPVPSGAEPAATSTADEQAEREVTPLRGDEPKETAGE